MKIIPPLAYTNYKPAAGQNAHTFCPIKPLQNDTFTRTNLAFKGEEKLVNNPTLKNICKDENPKCMKKAHEILEKLENIETGSRFMYKDDMASLILRKCKNKDGKFCESALDFISKSIDEFQKLDEKDIKKFCFYSFFCPWAKNVLKNSKDSRGNFIPETADFLNRAFPVEQLADTFENNITFIMNIAAKNGIVDEKTADFIISLSAKGYDTRNIRKILTLTKNSAKKPLNEKLAADFNALSDEFGTSGPGRYRTLRTFLECYDYAGDCLDKNRLIIYKDLWNDTFRTELYNIIINNLKTDDGSYNFKAAKKLKEFYKLVESNKEPLKIIASCINDAKNNKINEENCKFFENLMEKGYESPEKIITNFYNQTYKSFDREGAKLFIEILDEAKNHKQELRQTFEDLSDEEIERFFFNNIKIIEEATRLAGKNAIISAFSMKLENFENIIQSIASLFSALSNNEQIQPLLRITNPENSERYQAFQGIINYSKEIIKNSKTPEQKSLENENNEKIQSLNAEISVLKKELSQKAGSEARIRDLKKQIKEKTAKIKALHAQTQQFLKENLSDEVKKAIKSVNDADKACKKLVQNSIQDPQEIIQKLVMLSATYDCDTEYFEDFLKKMNPKTPQEKEAFNEFVSKKLYNYLGCEYDKKATERLNLEHSKYFANLFMAQYDFQENFSKLFDLIKKNPEKSTGEILDSLNQNIHTRIALEKRDIDYSRWANADKNSFVRVNIQTDVEKAKKAAVSNLEMDFNDPAFDTIPEKERKKLVDALKNAGIELLEKQEVNYDADGLTNGQKTVRRLYYGGEPIKFDRLGKAIEAIKCFMNKEDFWNTSSDDKKVENARTTLLNHMLKLRANDYKNAQNMKNDGEVELEVHQTDMNNISHALFLGNHAGCCTAVGTGCNEWSAPTYIMNKCISGIEVMDGKEFVGNTMCYIADVDEEEALVLDNIELSAKYQYNDAIRDAIIEYAKKLTGEIGRPDLPIYAGPYRHKVDLENFEFQPHEVQILGSTGDDEVYIDFLTDGMQIEGDESECVWLYRLR